MRPAPVTPALPALRSIRILDQLRKRIRLLHYSCRIEEAYVHWCRAFIHVLKVGGGGVRSPMDSLVLPPGLDAI